MKMLSSAASEVAPVAVPAVATPCASSFALGVTSSHAPIGPDPPSPEKVN